MKEMTGEVPKEWLDFSETTKVKVTIEMELTNEDFSNLDVHLVEAYRKFSEITKGNITGGKVEEV